MIRLVYALLMSLAIGPTVTGQQTTRTTSDVLTLARSGESAEAWRRWSAEPDTPEKFRLGVTLAIETQQLARGIDIYSQLAAKQGAPDRPALTDLAVAAARELVTSSDPEARMLACGAALALRSSDAKCRQVVTELTTSADADERAWGFYALADAGIPQRPDDLRIATQMMSKNLRVRIARGTGALPAGERVALIEPLLNDANVATRYQALLVLGDIPGKEARDALASARAGSLPTPLETAALIGLARHGDPSSLAAITERLPHLGDYEKIQAARALAAANDARGTALLQQLLDSPVDIDRLNAVEAFADRDPIAARRAVTNLVTNGGPAIRQRALTTAGALELGTEPVVYRWLSDPSPLVRAAAVGAIRQTFAAQDARRKT